MTSLVEGAVLSAQADLEEIRRLVEFAHEQAFEEPQCIVDGSKFNPPWRALEGGYWVWRSAMGSVRGAEIVDAYAEIVDNEIDALGLYWNEGRLMLPGGER